MELSESQHTMTSMPPWMQLLLAPHMADQGYQFTSDWFSGNIPAWQTLLGPVAGRPGLRALEVGSYEGRSATWLLDNIMTHDTSRLFCVDTFEGAGDTQSAAHTAELLARFTANTRRHGDRVKLFQGRSAEVLMTKHEELGGAESLDFVYIDGDHHSWNVISDACMCFPLVKRGGLVIFDDFLSMELSAHSVHTGVSAFLDCFREKIRIVHVGYQLVVSVV